MLWTLLRKDWKRACRNPWRYLLHLALPIVITALIGLAFGGAAKGKSGLGLIKVAVVDEDDSVLTMLLPAAMSRGEAKKYLETQFLPRDKALQLLNKNELSAVVIIPPHFTRTYLRAESPVTLEVIKNPAQMVHPAIVEEFMRVVVTALNAAGRNLRADLPGWLELFEGKRPPDLQTIASLLLQTGARFDQSRAYLLPPLAGYETEIRKQQKKEEIAGNIFAYLLPGLAAMFLLFLADNSVRDLYRELEAGTFDRFRTLRQNPMVLIISKVVLTFTILLVASAILFGGGGIIFAIHWREPVRMLCLSVGYALFAAGLMACIAALARNERRADVLNAATLMLMSFAAGSFFPTRQLPGFLRDHLSPLLPNYWFIEGMRALQFGGSESAWLGTTLKMAALGIVLVMAATALFGHFLERGIRE